MSINPALQFTFSFLFGTSETQNNKMLRQVFYKLYIFNLVDGRKEFLFVPVGVTLVHRMRTFFFC